MRVIHAGVLTWDALNTFLLTDVDLLVAMGASALEGGRLGVPTVPLDPSYGAVPVGYGFRWLHESSGCSLGEFVRPLSTPRRPLSALLDELDAEYPTLSDRAYGYCRMHHALEDVVDRVLRLAGKVQFRYGDFRPASLRRGLMRKAYDLYQAASHG